MNTEERDDLNSLTEQVLAAIFEVSNTLGAGFLEKVYENALMVELRYSGVQVAQQPSFVVRYREEIVGSYVPDLIVEGAVIVEVKALSRSDPVHRMQCMNYLHTTGLNVALLVNFGLPRLDVQRVVYEF